MGEQLLLLGNGLEDSLMRSYLKEPETGIERMLVRGSLSDLLKWLCVPPQYTTLRINTKAATACEALACLRDELQKQCEARGIPAFDVRLHPVLPDCLLVHNRGPRIPEEQAEKEVIVDLACGMAVLRGADVFKQGIMGAPSNMVAGERVRVMADLDGSCLRGFTKEYHRRKMYVGTGVTTLSRDDLFCNKSDTEMLRGVGIWMTEALYQAPSLSDTLRSLVFPQNLPSIVCGHVLDPKPGQSVLDMCAAPGGKTTHIATLMKDQGRVVALDKTADKVSKIQHSLDNFKLTCVEAYAFDARRAVAEDAEMSGGPPFPPGTFDCVLLDGPCSALGQRPSACNKMSASTLASFPKLQRMLLTTAVRLVRPGGILVYSTCTVPMEENEDQVAWVLHSFPDMVLEKQTPHLGGFGLPHPELSESECCLLQRFDPSLLGQEENQVCDRDTIGFFIAKFRKRNT